MPTVIFSMGVVVAAFIGYRWWYNLNQEEVTNTIPAACANAGVVIVFGMIYKKVAVFLVNWENHRYEEEWESSLVTKNFAFQFVNAYIALFFVAFDE